LSPILVTVDGISNVTMFLSTIVRIFPWLEKVPC
jgi:hypothetical protein